MPGLELWSDKERKEVNDVLETGILMRYGFDGARKGIWTIHLQNFRQPLCSINFKRNISINNGDDCIRYWLGG